MTEKIESTSQQRRHQRLVSWFDDTSTNWTQCERQFEGVRDLIAQPAFHYRAEFETLADRPDMCTAHVQRALGLFMDIVGKGVLNTLMNINSYDTVAATSVVLSRYLEKNFNPEIHEHLADALFGENNGQINTIKLTFLNSVIVNLVQRAGGANPEQFLHHILNCLSLPYYLHAQLIDVVRKHMPEAATLH